MNPPALQTLTHPTHDYMQAFCNPLSTCQQTYHNNSKCFYLSVVKICSL